MLYCDNAYLHHCPLHTLSVSNFSHLRCIQARVALNSRIAQITVHSVNFREVLRAAFRADVHLKLLITAVIAIRKRQVNALIKALLHCPADKRFHSTLVVINRIADILDFAAVEQVPEADALALKAEWDEEEQAAAEDME